MDFSDEEDLEEGNGLTIKNASQYLAYKPVKKEIPKGDLRQTTGWFDVYANRGPKKEKWDHLVKKKKTVFSEFKKTYAQNRNTQFSMD